MKCDVIIVGAGPGGSMAALVLSRAGKRVLVLEKSTFPRSKVCGYSLPPRCWPMWGKYGLTDAFHQLPHFDLVGFTLEKEGRPIVRHAERSRTLEKRIANRHGRRFGGGDRVRFGKTHLLRGKFMRLFIMREPRTAVESVSMQEDVTVIHRCRWILLGNFPALPRLRRFLPA